MGFVTVILASKSKNIVYTILYMSNKFQLAIILAKIFVRRGESNVSNISFTWKISLFFVFVFYIYQQYTSAASSPMQDPLFLVMFCEFSIFRAQNRGDIPYYKYVELLNQLIVHWEQR